MIKTSIDFTPTLAKAIEVELKSQLDKEVDAAIKSFEERRGEIVAGIIVNLCKRTDMRIMEDRMVFEIRTDDYKEN